jgi:hypothetical protein
MQYQRPNTVEFDPVSADIWAPTRSNVNGVTKTVYVKVFNTRITPPRSMYTWERSNEQKPSSVSTQVITLWKYGMPLLTSDMYIMWRGRRFDIVGEMDRASWTDNTKAYEVRVASDPPQTVLA